MQRRAQETGEDRAEEPRGGATDQTLSFTSFTSVFHKYQENTVLDVTLGTKEGKIIINCIERSVNN